MNDKQESTNLELEFYDSLNIMVAKDKIDNMADFYKKREKLYCQCGIPINFFKGKNILEVGPAGGYTTLAFLNWGANVDLVEPSAKAAEELVHLFKEKGISPNKYHLARTVIEEYHTDKRYDFICAEGFLHLLSNKNEIIEKLINLSSNGGIIVITSLDEIGFFLERIKRNIGLYLARNITLIEEKAMYLAEFFKPFLEKLDGMSRTPTDWVYDQILQPLPNKLFSMKDALNLFPNNWSILGSSPGLFSDYSFYKDINYDVRLKCIIQFEQKHHNLFWTKLDESYMEQKDSRNIDECVNKLYELLNKYEQIWDKNLLIDIIDYLNKLYNITDKIDERFTIIIKQIIELYKEIEKKGCFNPDSFQQFWEAFGRAQNYLCMTKKYEYN